jgi:ribosomal protein S7
MVRFLIKKYKIIGWDIARWKKKKKTFQTKIDYDVIKLMILHWMLGRLNKKGEKAWSFFILMNILLNLKKIKKNKKPIDFLNSIILNVKQNVLLFNKRKGSLVFELPRFIVIEQSIKKVIEWLIKVSSKNKKKITDSIIIELENILLKKGEFWKKKKDIIDILKKNEPFFYLLKKRKKKR